MDVHDITTDRVRAALRYLARDRSPARTPLSDMEVVRRALDDAGLRPTPAACQYEVGHLLAEVVEAELAHLRRRADLRVPAGPAAAAIAADFSCGQRELESWSAVYHLCLRPDLDLSLKGLTEILADRHLRTVQRRLRRGVAALVVRLQEMERAAQLASRRERLADRLPGPPIGELVGVDDLLQQVQERLGGPSGQPPVVLRGPGGIGKTAVALGVAQQGLAQSAFEDVAWVAAEETATDGPESTPLLLTAIARQLAVAGRAPDPPETLRTRLRRQPTLVVVDGVDDFARASRVVADLAVVSGASRALVTGRLGGSAWGLAQVLEVPALDGAAADALLRREAAQRNLLDVAAAAPDTLAPVVAAAQGHPVALRLAAAQLRAHDAAGVARTLAAGNGGVTGLCQDLWATAWRRIGIDGQAVVRAVVDLDDAGDAADRPHLGAVTLLGEPALDNALSVAVDEGLLEPAGSLRRRTYRPALFVRRYLRCVS